MRPFEPTGMTTALWKEIPPIEIEIDLLTPTQEKVCDHPLPEGHSFCGDPHIHIVYFHSTYYISDGHNRVNEAKQRGDKFIKARILIKA